MVFMTDIKVGKSQRSLMREARLAQSLRDNLSKRKALARAKQPEVPKATTKPEV